MRESQPVPPAAGATNPGEALQHAREQQGLSRPELAERLHMRSDQIEALECNQQQRWPEDVFTIAQVRRLADALGLEADPLLGGFRLALKQRSAGTSAAAQAVMQASLQRSAPTPSREEGRRDWVSSKAAQNQPSNERSGGGWLLPGLLVLAVLGIGGAGLHRLASQGNLPLPALSNLPELPKLPALSLPGTQPSSPLPEAEAETIAPAPAPVPQELSVAISNDEAVWLAVRRLKDQQLLFEGLLQGEQIFPLEQGLQVLAGRPDLVVVGLGDQSPNVLGSIETIQWVTFKPPAADPQAP